MRKPESAEHTVEIRATPSDCFNTVIDFESYPRWCSAVKKTTALEYDSGGLARRVEFLVSFKVKDVRYVLQYRYRRPNQVDWRSVDGDLESIEGAYRYRKLGPKLTSATCRQSVSLGFWVPAAVRDLLQQKALRQSVLEFKHEVERRVGSAGRADARPDSYRS
jgi:ribosome-associated toxin RatA of RatAB toxin-antitoxin module